MSFLPSDRRTRGNTRGANRNARNASSVMPETLEARRLFAVLWAENFNGLNYGPNQEEGVAGTEVWTNYPPVGWNKNDTGVPGYNEPASNNGVKEWIGWSFAQKDWWVTAAGDQTRSMFESASGGVMIADPDEWDDADHPGDFQDESELYNATIETPVVSLANLVPGSAQFEFDSSWRPEGFDDGAAVNNQTGIVEAVYSNGTEELIHYDSDPFGEFFKGDTQDEHVVAPLHVPEGATSVRFRFTMAHAANDWWWAVDNLSLTGELSGPPASQVTQVFVNGPGLTGATTNANTLAFRTMAGIDPTYGYAVPAGANQLKWVPWTGGINSVAIRFDSDVNAQLQQGDLAIRGVATPTYVPTVFNYDPATKTGVWTFPTVTNDKLRFYLDDALVSGLDGEWANGADTFPSGNGTPGGDFDFRVNVLGGDATQDGRVNALDLSFIKQRLNRSATNPGSSGATYSPFADIDANGTINALDLSAARARQNRTAPTGEPLATALLFER